MSAFSADRMKKWVCSCGREYQVFCKPSCSSYHLFVPLSTVLDSRLLRRKLYQRATSSFSRHLFGHAHRMLLSPSSFFACYQQQVWHIVALRHLGVVLLWHYCMLVWAVSSEHIFQDTCLAMPIACYYHHHPSLPANNSKCGILWHWGMLALSYCGIEQHAGMSSDTSSSPTASVCPSAIQDIITRFVI